MQSTLASLTSSQLRRAAGLQEKIETLQAELNRLTGGESAKPVGRPPGKKKRTMSLEARAKIAAAQRRRWARQKAAAK